MPIKLCRPLIIYFAFLPSLLSAAELSLPDLRPGDLVVTEYLADPVVVADADGEYFEIFNTRSQSVDLSGLIVRDAGSNEFTVSALTIAGLGLAVFSSSDGSALGISPDYVYGGAMSLTNTDDEILLIGSNGMALFSVEYGDGDAFGDGISHELAFVDPARSLALGPGLGDDFIAASNPLPNGNFGSPGSLGNSLPAVPVPPAAWLFGSALALLWETRRRCTIAPG